MHVGAASENVSQYNWVGNKSIAYGRIVLGDALESILNLCSSVRWETVVLQNMPANKRAVLVLQLRLEAIIRRSVAL